MHDERKSPAATVAPSGASFEMIRAFDGTLRKFSAKSSALGGLETAFNVFVPAKTDSPVGPRRWNAS